jgi:hypothetical protein
MAIDILKERTLKVSAAARFVGRLLGRRAVSSATIQRWMRKGRFGVRLEFLSTPSGRVVSVEALQRFFSAITTAAHRARPDASIVARRPSMDERLCRATAILDGTPDLPPPHN